MVTTQRRFARVDDKDDSDLFDPRYPGKRVVADGKGIRVPVSLTDAMPPGWPPSLPHPGLASRHRPHQFAVLSDAQLKDARQRAMDAYEARSRWLEDAWRAMSPGTGGAAKTRAPPANDPGDDDSLSPRDQYVRRVSNMWRTPVRQPDQNSDNADADAVAALTRQWLSPGARPGGGGYGYGDAAPRTVTKDAIADRDQAYDEYVSRISNGWRR